MPKIPGLQRRRQTWFVRIRMPEDLVTIYQKGEIIRSLGTRDYDAARKRIHIERAKINSEFEERRHQMKAAANDADIIDRRWHR